MQNTIILHSLASAVLSNSSSRKKIFDSCCSCRAVEDLVNLEFQLLSISVHCPLLYQTPIRHHVWIVYLVHFGNALFILVTAAFIQLKSVDCGLVSFVTSVARSVYTRSRIPSRTKYE